MKKNILLFDWDNTIASGTGEFHETQLKSAIQSKINEGWYVGLNSDTPLRRLQSWWNRLGMNGPIIAEKGVVLWWPDNQEIILSQTAPFFEQIRGHIILSLTQHPDVGVFVGDSTPFIRSLGSLPGNDSVLVAVDAYRSCSLGLFVRQIDNAKLITVPSVTSEIGELIATLVPYHPWVSAVGLNFEHGFISMNAIDTDKTKGVQMLLEHWGFDSEVVMIGDSLADYLCLPQVSHFAVANAHIALKQKASRIATKSYSEGCIELLSSI